MKFGTKLIYGLLQTVLVCLFVLCITVDCNAIELTHYAQKSAMAEGRWVKISVEETGMQFVSNSQLKQMGFSDPSKVNVYGYGGRMISETLDARQIDDLPMQPIRRTSKGLVFFGVGTISWKEMSKSDIFYIPKQNLYSNKSYYFLSDRSVDAEVMQPSIGAAPTSSDIEQTTFRERLLHEKELFAPANTGALLLGEDFKSNPTQMFNFELPGHSDDIVDFIVSFGAKTTNGSTSLTFKVNGTQLSASSSDVISAVTGSVSDMHVRLGSSRKKVTGVDNKMALQINCSQSGVPYLARLDYIAVNYNRSLSIKSGPVYFAQKIEEGDNVAFCISDCSSQTEIWDVTNPALPMKVNFVLSGSMAKFAPQAVGLREYVAFNAETVTRQPKKEVEVKNQNIHGLENPNMVIITVPEYFTQAERIAEMHESMDGMRVYVFTQDEIYNEFSSGTPDLSSFRKMLKMFYDRGTVENGDKLGYCLLFGRPTYDNRICTERVKSSGYPRVLIWQSETSASESSSYSTDDYIAMLEDDETEFNIMSAKLSIGVGRMPVRSLSEAQTSVDKLIRYVTAPDYGAWRNNVMVIADDEDHGVHLDQAEKVYSALRGAGNGNNFIYERLYFDAYPLGTSSSGKSYPLVRQRLQQMLKDGVSYIDYIGHANPTSWSHEGVLTYSDIIGMSNTRLPFFYTATCEFTRWDSDDISGSEIMWLNPDAGAIGFISATRKVYIDNNGLLNEETSKWVFARGEDGLPLRVGDIYKNGKNSYGRSESNKLRYMLMADPAMRLQSPSLSVEIDEINGINSEGIADASDYPVISARSKVRVCGRITNLQGETVSDFNGVMIPTLFDAERTIETYANGTAGEKRIYNDRKNKLFVGRVPVVDGKWEMTILMPTEIDNNYSPALLNFYAYSENGLEANGATEKLYVYGWDKDAAEDVEGPEITLLALNNESFKSGATVGTSPLLVAKFKDESGINISTSGIGHQMNVIVDGNKIYDDVSANYQPDGEDPGAGEVTYLLPALEDGPHRLSFTVWDNANNSSTAEIEFNVSKGMKPEIADIYTNANPASTDVTFYVTHNRQAESLETQVDVFDMAGNRVWSGMTNSAALYSSAIKINWNLKDMGGMRVPRGIYLYRATVTTADGVSSSKTKKLAVTAQ